jgi:hypothetical protein
MCRGARRAGRSYCAPHPGEAHSAVKAADVGFNPQKSGSIICFPDRSAICLRLQAKDLGTEAQEKDENNRNRQLFVAEVWE